MNEEARMKPKNEKLTQDKLTEDQLEDELEEGLEETFPASDAPSATQPVHHEQKTPGRKH
jgi:hypothetical protein